MLRPDFAVAEPETEEEEAAALDEEGFEVEGAARDDEVDGGKHEPISTTSASCGGKGPRQPPVAASQACEDPKIVAT